MTVGRHLANSNPSISSPGLQESSGTSQTESSRKLGRDLEKRDISNTKLQELCSPQEKIYPQGKKKSGTAIWAWQQDFRIKRSNDSWFSTEAVIWRHPDPIILELYACPREKDKYNWKSSTTELCHSMESKQLYCRLRPLPNKAQHKEEHPILSVRQGARWPRHLARINKKRKSYCAGCHEELWWLCTT